jgi:hypothetical protein
MQAGDAAFGRQTAGPFTTGILIGIGETRNERIDALEAIRSARRTWSYPGSHRPEFQGQACHQAGQFRRTRSRRPALDHRDRAFNSRAPDEYPGAAKSVAWSLSKADRRRAQRLGRDFAGHAGSCEPRGAVACHCRTRPRERGRRQAAGEPPARLPRLRARRRYLSRFRYRRPRATHERH